MLTTIGLLAHTRRAVNDINSSTHLTQQVGGQYSNIVKPDVSGSLAVHVSVGLAAHTLRIGIHPEKADAVAIGCVA